MNTFRIALAELNIEVSARHEFAKRFCRDYLTDGAPALYASASDADLSADQAAVPGTSEAYAETLGIYRSIAEQLPMRGAFLVHGAAIAYGGKAYLFTAPSGTGKTTHISLWKKYLGDDVQIVNGDKPGRENDDDVYVFVACGMAVFDVAWAYDVYKSALEKGVGQTLTIWDKPTL